MTVQDASTNPAFPWLPGEAHRLPDPPWTYRDEPEPPGHLMLTLAMLARGFRPQDSAPAEWLEKIGEDALNSPIRSFANNFGLRDQWDEERQTNDWYDLKSEDSDGTTVVLPRTVAMQRCWSGYAQLLLDELLDRGETPAQAVERIPRQWHDWRDARTAEFIAEWRDVVAWPPALALSWIMFDAKWEAMAAYHENGKFMPVDGLQLELAASLFGVNDSEIKQRRPHPVRALSHAMRLGSKNPHRARAFGLLNGKGLMTEISPFDHLLLGWSEEGPGGCGAVLRGPSGTYFTEVHIDAESLQLAFPAKDLPPGPQPGEQMKAWLIRRHNLQKASMEQARAYAREWRRSKGLPTDEESIESQAKSIQVQLTSLSTERAGK